MQTGHTSASCSAIAPSSPKTQHAKHASRGIDLATSASSLLAERLLLKLSRNRCRARLQLLVLAAAIAADEVAGGQDNQLGARVPRITKDVVYPVSLANFGVNCGAGNARSAAT